MGIVQIIVEQNISVIMPNIVIYTLCLRGVFVFERSVKRIFHFAYYFLSSVNHTIALILSTANVYDTCVSVFHPKIIGLLFISWPTWLDCCLFLNQFWLNCNLSPSRLWLDFYLSVSHRPATGLLLLLDFYSTHDFEFVFP